MRLGLIADEHERQIALLSERYGREYAEAKKAGANWKTLSDVHEAHLLEVDQLEAQRATRRATARRDAAYALRLLRAGLIEDEHKREIALINERYKYEQGRLAERGGDPAVVKLTEEQRELELALAAQRELGRERDRLAGVEGADLQRRQTIRELELRSKLKGVELASALLELNRKQAIERARAAGTDLKLVEKEYGLRQKLLDMRGTGISERLRIAGTFSAQEARGMGPSSLEERRTRDTGIVATGVRRMVELLSTIESQNRLAGRYR